MALFGRLVAPGKGALGLGQGAAVRPRLSQSRGLPLGLQGQPASGPATVCTGLVPIDVDHGAVGLERRDGIEVAHCPAAGNVATGVAEPIDGMLGGLLLSPGPAVVVPKVSAPIPAVIDEGGEFRVGDGGTGDAERRDLDGVRPFLVVIDERGSGLGTEPERTPRNLGITLQGPGVRGELEVGEPGPGIGKGLAGIGKGLGVHVFMKCGELV